MLPSVYQSLAFRTECDQASSRARMGGDIPERFPSQLIPIRVNHAIIGLAGELGELAEILEKWVYYGKEFTLDDLRQQFKDEVGDCCWYLAELLNAVGVNFDEVLEANIAKLKVRYPKKYANELAEEANRNRPAELAAQETLQSHDAP